MSESLHPPSNQAPPAQIMLRMANAYRISQVIYVTAQLGLADLLAQGARSSGALAEATHTHAPSLQRMLRMLVALGVFTEDDEDRFALTEIGATLQSNQSHSVRNAVLFLTAEPHWRA